MKIIDLLVSTALESDFLLRSEHNRALENMKTCHTIDRGGRILECPECGTRIVMYNPCNQRGCPSCYLKNQITWNKKARKKLLPTDHVHLIFSIPRRYASVWLKNKRSVIDSSFVSANKALKELEKEYGLHFGYILAFQSHGKSLCYKPHIHCILTAGGLSENNEWIKLGSIHYTHLEKVFKETFYTEIASKTVVDDLFELDDSNKNEWNVYSTFHKNNGNKIVGYLSHSMSGVVINMKQDFKYSENGNDITFKQKHDGNTIETTLSKKDFTERYLNHIPPSSCVTVRHYGLYSNRNVSILEDIRKSMNSNLELVVDSEKEEIFICPDCSARMNIVFEICPQFVPDFSIYGFINGPPEHGAIHRVA